MLDKSDIIKDISKRTDGDIYFGVVGAVRTGKSTFIKRMMELVVLPNITDEFERERAQDELPQSAAGKTIMTTEPKFVPNQAVEIELAEDFPVQIRLVDCVGYAVKGANGFEDDDGPRMVHTPWYEEAIPFHDAAEIGTRKVIQEHSTIGIVVTTDGTIGEIERENYIEAETTVIEELLDVGKPFLVIVNSKSPTGQKALDIKEKLELTYGIPVIPMNVEHMNERDVYHVLQEALYEFPIIEVTVNLPSWVLALYDVHWLRKTYESVIAETMQEVRRLRDVKLMTDHFMEDEYIEHAYVSGMEMGEGIAQIELQAPDGLYEQIVTEIVGEEIRDKEHLLSLLQAYAHAKKEYDQIADALHMVKQTGYGIAAPSITDMELDEPEMIKQGSRYGVKLKAVAPSIHMIKVDVSSEFSPIIGTEKQSEELVNYLMRDFEEDPLAIWQSDIFGRSLHEIVREGIQAKISLLPENARYKLKETLEKMTNEGSGSMIAIMI